MPPLHYIFYDLVASTFPSHEALEAIALLVSRIGPIDLMHNPEWGAHLCAVQEHAAATLPVTLVPYEECGFFYLYDRAEKVLFTADADENGSLPDGEDCTDFTYIVCVRKGYPPLIADRAGIIRRADCLAQARRALRRTLETPL